jgi:hypothetical protein
VSRVIKEFWNPGSDCCFLHPNAFIGTGNFVYRRILILKVLSQSLSVSIMSAEDKANYIPDAVTQFYAI